jgi:hypothetical protein
MMSQDAPVQVRVQVSRRVSASVRGLVQVQVQVQELEPRRVAGLEPERARRQVPVQALQQERHLLLRRRQ